MFRAANCIPFVALLAVGATACSSHSTTAAHPPAPSSTTATAGRSFDAVLDDAGLHLPAGRIQAADYHVTFEDRRSHVPSGQVVSLRFRPSGPDITLFEVPAGETRDDAIPENMTAYVAIDGHDARLPVDHPLDVVATKQYPVPVT